MKTEKNIENYLKMETQKRRGLCLKFTSPGMIGVPDRIVILPTGNFFVEVKAPGKHPRSSQIAMHGKIARAGQRVWVVDSYDKVNQALDEMEGKIAITRISSIR